jgi:hypothetical protein
MLPENPETPFDKQLADLPYSLRGLSQKSVQGTRESRKYSLVGVVSERRFKPAV